ncbi:DNA repair and recombination protein rhm52 [Metarhizium album ARSEF 1941]|uniref:RAD52 homolog n=1 Tax=Metarhizium album (strain ARSEF 1941) TaxID=1081103 RepID=A0A0B2WZD7_METAS|nr:DNA repair and recombination protein rhm52 [Metarhizium album ARSEF 1941]KHN99403.1 DNA repair and recombination protein rhm52 [Metarhizium album ARSEF 1941]
MPAPGDQHTSWENPFEEAKPRVSAWSAKEIATIASKLDKQLGPEYISSRSGPGGSRVHYLTAEKVIGLANEVFGFNGWSSSIQNIQVDFADENPQTQRVSIGLSVIVRVTLRDGTYHEDIGYGSIENAKGKATAFEKAKKEGTTDGLKRALRSFGNVLGNCIYDTDYVKQVTKVKAQPVKKFNQDNLHRHSDFVRKDASMSGTSATAGPVKNTTAPATLSVEAAESFEDFLGEIDEADFCVTGEGHPDEIVVHQLAPMQAQGPKPPPNEPGQVQAQAQGPSRPTMRAVSGGFGPQGPQMPNSGGNAQSGGAVRDSPRMNNTAAPPMPPPGGDAAMFFSARSISRNSDVKELGLGSSQVFNPKAESPSIRKTPGIDHTSSKPVSRNGQHVAPANSQSGASSSSAAGFTPVRPGGPATRGHLINPSLDQARKIGAPGAAGSPLANRGSYRPPTMKRPLPGETGTARAPLVDLPANTAAQGNGTNTAASAAGGLDVKRQRTG